MLRTVTRPPVAPSAPAGSCQSLNAGVRPPPRVPTSESMNSSRSSSSLERAGQRDHATFQPSGSQPPYFAQFEQVFSSSHQAGLSFRHAPRLHPQPFAAPSSTFNSVAIVPSPPRSSPLPDPRPTWFPHAILAVRQRFLSSASPSFTTIRLSFITRHQNPSPSSTALVTPTELNAGARRPGSGGLTERCSRLALARHWRSAPGGLAPVAERRR